MELLELGKTPISASNPSGDDVRLEPIYEELEKEISKLSSPSASSIDWNKVVKLSGDILGGKSKDLLVASYLCIGLLSTGELKGLASGVHIIKEMLENFWETLYPAKKRMRGRLNAIGWLSERIDAATPNLKKETWPRQDKERFTGELSSIDEFLSGHIDDAPILRRMNESLGELVEVIPEKPPEPPPEEKKAGEETSRESPELAGEPRQTADTIELAGNDPDKLLDQGLEILGRAATLFFAQDQPDPLPFRINRISAWSGVANLPPVSDGKSLLPPPEEDVINLMNTLYQSQNWRELLDAAESRVRQYVFWFDLSRYAAESLEHLGSHAASEAVGEETLHYAGRLPGIEKLAFSDGTPFAAEATKEWLQDLASKSGGMRVSGSGSRTEQSVESALGNAFVLINENRIADALNGFREKMGQVNSLRDRYLWQAGMCRLLIRANLPRLALPYFHAMLDAMETYNVERWEPALALDGLALILTGLRLQDERFRDEAFIEKILDRISVLNPAQALEMLQ